MVEAKGNEELEKLAYEYQLLQAQAQLLAQNLELLTVGKNEFEAAKATVEALKKEGRQSEILVPIGAGSFLKGALTDTERAIVSVGAGYAVEKNLGDAVEYFEARINEYSEAITKTRAALGELENKLQELARKAQELSK
ncbi:prefoldin subunit alpha [Thermococcus sp. Bubb.Bath]|uniref:prefoldin subunit alpha n=1 Tax=Thermococcus sp. Bubb.Bath TaxID=1638242 RepID=UPI0014394954|nr:prefoldin subunit alpha [Thermococcus sp. Bubb.Bath]NJF24097.1 prefoldin subunit alpha [Thermococcus sp. Bubb.Bath]